MYKEEITLKNFFHIFVLLEGSNGIHINPNNTDFQGTSYGHPKDIRVSFEYSKDIPRMYSG